MRIKKIVRLLTVLLAFPFALAAQVTTGSISGSVKDAKGADLTGATIEVLHEPSGTLYRGTSGKNGVFNIPSLRVGGPYKVTISFVGFKPEVITDVNVQLGEASKINVTLTDANSSLKEVIVAGTARKGSLISKDRKGTSTNINRRLIAALPTLSRNITDFTKLTPQASGTSFAGQDNRFINLTVDGSIFNNSFGLQALPGSQTSASPISVDAIEEIQVNVSPYSVKDAGFTGASINAVTRSGTNTFHGSAFYNNRNQSLVGTKAGSDGKTPVTIANFDVKQFGFSLGGPIIKNKLFFFANYENEKRNDPGTAFVSDNGSNTGQTNVSRVKKTDLDALSSFLNTNFGYDPGKYEGYDFITKSYKILAKIDWNISNKNKFSVRFNSLRSFKDIGSSSSGVLGGSRVSNLNTMNYSNNNYEINNDIYSLIGQLNTRISNKISNELIFGWTANRDYRAVKGKLFPLVDILDGTTADRNYISFGAEPFTPNNKLFTDTWQASDNITFYNGKHTTSAGANFESFKFFNQFTPQIQGQFIFKSLADFYTSANAYLANNNMATNPVQLRRYILGFSNLAGNEVWNAITQAKNIGAYIQDEWQIEDKLNITYGVRFDVPFFTSNAVYNPQVAGYSFVDENGNPTKLSTSQLPSAKLMINPRFGFNYDLKGDKKTQLRGGLGLFSGRPAFVFVSNAVGNNGMQAGQISQDNTVAYPFSPNINRNVPTPNPGSPAPSYNIAPIEKNFRFPQVFRTNMAVDQKIIGGIVGSAEFLFTQSLSNIFYYNANQKVPTTTFAGPDKRPKFAGSAAAVRINSNVNDATVLASRPYGSNTSVTLKLEQPLQKGLSWMIAYNFGRTKDYSSASTIAFSSFTSTRTVNGNNLPDNSFSDNDTRHRVIGNVTYRKEFAKAAALQISLYGQSQSQGRFGFGYSNDMNGDGISGNDLMYIPKDQSEMNFDAITGTTPFTVQQQKDAFEAYIQNNSYLKNHRGQVAQRNGVLQPMLSRFDLSAMVEIFKNFGKQRHTIQFRADIFNIGNMIDHKWGVAYVTNTTSPLAYSRVDANGVPYFKMNVVNNSLTYETYRKGTSIADVWQGQLGIRYIF
ncbi:TonB-dependent receptor [Ferruginibacter sp. SUN106]|uniref:TonB-dependent receptor n=1 Tax=Ferruginibacter sp. SUN106 TaxID=2978348 RepID=UPI003D36AFFC